MKPARSSPLVLSVLALLLAACQSAAEPPPSPEATPTPTAEATATPRSAPIDILPTRTATPPPPTATPLPPAAANGLWVIDLARDRQIVLVEGDEGITSRVEDSGSAISAYIPGLSDADRPTAIRFSPTGDRIEEHPARGLITTSPNGESRFYLDLEDPEAPQLVLEHRGEPVPIEGTRPRVGLSFSPSGDRLLALSERPGTTQGEVVRTFSVHATIDGRLRMQFEHRALAGSPPVARWSPSGRYIADEGLAGLAVRDTVTGMAWLLGPGGSARWSPIDDRLLAITPAGRLSIVDIPALSGVDLGPIDRGAHLQFDRSGTLAVVTTRSQDSGPITVAFDVDSGLEVSRWSGMDASQSAVGGAEPVIALPIGVAALFRSEAACDRGFVVFHPALGADQGRCIQGANPRWSPNGRLLVYARNREIVLLSLSSDVERVVAEGTPPAAVDGGPLLDWSPDGSWVLVQWSAASATGE